MAFVDMDEYNWSQNTTEYIKFRNVGGDGQCGYWTVWDELGKNPGQKEFLEAMERQNLDYRRLKVTGWNNHEPNNGGLLGYGMSKQFYIPHLYDWDLSIFTKDYNSVEEYPESILKPCPFCGGRARFSEGYEGESFTKEDFIAVICTTCGINTRSMSRSTRFKEDAVKIWNRRV